MSLTTIPRPQPPSCSNASIRFQQPCSQFGEKNPHWTWILVQLDYVELLSPSVFFWIWIKVLFRMRITPECWSVQTICFSQLWITLYASCSQDVVNLNIKTPTHCV